MFKIKLKGENLLQITWKPVTPDSEGKLDRVAECTALDDSHGGIVHAEPN